MTGSGRAAPDALRRPEAVPRPGAFAGPEPARLTSAPSIELESVSFAYPGGPAVLSDIGVGIAPGERVALVGQNGSGKSTLVRHLNGLLRPTAGRVLLDGRDVRHVHVARLAATVGLVFQNPDRQIFSRTVQDEVSFGPRNLGVRGPELTERVHAALEAVGLERDVATNPYDLGYSRRKLLALASVLAMRTAILVLDEPTTGQDARGVARVRRVVDDVAAEGRTVVTISHDMRFVAETSSRVVVLREGRVVADGTPEVVFAPSESALLASTGLEPPPAARVGARLGLGSTPTEAALVGALMHERSPGPRE